MTPVPSPGYAAVDDGKEILDSGAKTVVCSAFERLLNVRRLPYEVNAIIDVRTV